jgi:hypothetical protein
MPSSGWTDVMFSLLPKVAYIRTHVLVPDQRSLPEKTVLLMRESPASRTSPTGWSMVREGIEKNVALSRTTMLLAKGSPVLGKPCATTQDGLEM